MTDLNRRAALRLGAAAGFMPAFLKPAVKVPAAFTSDAAVPTAESLSGGMQWWHRNMIEEAGQVYLQSLGVRMPSHIASLRSVSPAMKVYMAQIYNYHRRSWVERVLGELN